MKNKYEIIKLLEEYEADLSAPSFEDAILSSAKKSEEDFFTDLEERRLNWEYEYSH